jgi:hypothetical protein
VESVNNDFPVCAAQQSTIQMMYTEGIILS